MCRIEYETSNAKSKQKLDCIAEFKERQATWTRELCIKQKLVREGMCQEVEKY